jgi:AcrR family transcriptional regulator
MLEAAGRLFGAHRFHEVRMEDIAAEAEVGKGTLYRYFSDKEELYFALLERASRQFLERLAVEKARRRCPREQLEAVVAAILAFFDEHPHLFDLIQRAEVLRDPDRTFPWQKTRHELIKFVRELFQEGEAQGAFTIRDPDISVLMLLGGLRSVIRFGKQPRPKDLAQRLVDGFLHGVGTRRGG